MSTGKRAYDILRGYLSTEWDRIKDLEHELASRELRREEQLPPIPEPQTPISTPLIPAPEPAPTGDQKAYARKLLGVSESSSFDELRKAYTRLKKRSDPANFPVGTEEARRAAELQRKVVWAYNLLTETSDSTERRFRTLELD